MEVPRLRVESELQLQVYTTATATRDLSRVCDLYAAAHGKVRSLTHWGRPGIEPTSSWVLVGFMTCWTTTETPSSSTSILHISKHFKKSIFSLYHFLLPLGRILQLDLPFHSFVLQLLSPPCYQSHVCFTSIVLFLMLNIGSFKQCLNFSSYSLHPFLFP